MPSIAPSTFTPAVHTTGASQAPSSPAPLTTDSTTLSDKVTKDLTRSNYKITDNNRNGRTDISYTFFNPSDPQTSHLANSGALEFNNNRKAAFKKSIQAWEDVIKVKFTENAKGADHFIVVHGNAGVGGYATMPDKSGRANIGIGLKNTSQDNSAMIHELGHSLGLEHPQGTYAENNHAHTAMSYQNNWWSRPDAKGVRTSEDPPTPMMHDIAAAQRLYEPNYETRKGDTTYGFNSNTERDHYSLKSADDKPVFCIWDGGGNDTLDFSGFKQNQTINLNAESHSDVGGRKQNVSIAKGVVMENAIGGAGDDVLIGNHVGNRITGGSGGDSMTGGGGGDKFVYNRASDSPLENPDMIEDFTTHVDKIDIRAVLKEAGIRTPEFVTELTGKKGQLLLSYDEDMKVHRLALDLSGNAKSVLLIHSSGQINPADILIDGKPPLPEPTPSPTPQPEPAPLPQDDNINTVFGFNSNTGEKKTSLTTAHEKPSFTVSDEAGNDTLDFSGFKQDQIINLAPGTRSSVGGMDNNVLIAPETIIENAIGGAGNDRITGHGVDNKLTGGAGADNLTGGGGYNTFIYKSAGDSPRDNADLLMDFTTGKDKIDLTEMRQETQLTFEFVDRYSNKAGETILTHNPRTGRYFLGIDLTGNGRTDFLIKSLQPISSEDVIGLTTQEDGYI